MNGHLVPCGWHLVHRSTDVTTDISCHVIYLQMFSSSNLGYHTKTQWSKRGATHLSHSVRSLEIPTSMKLNGKDCCYWLYPKDLQFKDNTFQKVFKDVEVCKRDLSFQPLHPFRSYCFMVCLVCLVSFLFFSQILCVFMCFFRWASCGPAFLAANQHRLRKAKSRLHRSDQIVAKPFQHFIILIGS